MSRYRVLIILLTLAMLPVFFARAELPEEWKSWNQPVEPFRILGDLYYVGASEIAAFLLTSPDGHILLDGGFEETAPLIEESVRKLGFRLEDVKVLLNSHAHLDHAGGLARLKALTGATLMASRGDAPLLEAGGEEGLFFPPVKPDRLVEDGETIGIGSLHLTAHVTAGHTPGCTTWTTRIKDRDRIHDVLFLCSVNVLDGVDLLAEDPAYPDGRDKAFARSFDVLEGLPVDVFLGPHGSFFNMEKKRKLLGDGLNPFIDPDLYRRHVKAKKERFQEVVEEQRGDRGQN